MTSAISVVIMICIVCAVIVLVSRLWIWIATTWYSRRSTGAGIPAEQVARTMLKSVENVNVRINQRLGSLTDRYDSDNKLIELSEEVYGHSSVLAVAVAAHEAGHALQHAEGYSGLTACNAIRPLTAVGIIGAAITGVIGFYTSHPLAVIIAVLLVLAAIISRAMLLPIEYDASRRAIAALVALGQYSERELRGARHMLHAAAFTYVASLFDVLLKVVVVMLVILCAGGRKNKKCK